jgi:hypothetical protein
MNGPTLAQPAAIDKPIRLSIDNTAARCQGTHIPPPPRDTSGYREGLHIFTATRVFGCHMRRVRRAFLTKRQTAQPHRSHPQVDFAGGATARFVTQHPQLPRRHATASQTTERRSNARRVLQILCGRDFPPDCLHRVQIYCKNDARMSTA